MKALDRELIPPGFSKFVFPLTVRTAPPVAVPPPEILPVEESRTELVQLMNDLSLFNSELIQVEDLSAVPCEIVDDDEVAPPQGRTENKKKIVRVVGRLGFPTARPVNDLSLFNSEFIQVEDLSAAPCEIVDDDEVAPPQRMFGRLGFPTGGALKPIGTFCSPLGALKPIPTAACVYCGVVDSDSMRQCHTEGCAHLFHVSCVQKFRPLGVGPFEEDDHFYCIEH